MITLILGVERLIFSNLKHINGIFVTRKDEMPPCQEAISTTLMVLPDKEYTRKIQLKTFLSLDNNILKLIQLQYKYDNSKSVAKSKITGHITSRINFPKTNSYLFLVARISHTCYTIFFKKDLPT